MTSASERARRNADMAARKAAGATWDEIAAEFGVAKSTARKGAADHLAAGGDARLASSDSPAVTVVTAVETLSVRPEEALPDALAVYEWALSAAQRLAAEGDNSSARVGAIRAAVSVVEKRISLLQIAGRLPRDLAAVRHLLDLRGIAVGMLDAVDVFEREVEDPEAREAAARVRRAFNELVGIEDEDLPSAPRELAA